MSDRRCGEWTLGGKPWDFWIKSGLFLYVFGAAIGDDECPGWIAPRPIKIGITGNPTSRLQNLRRETERGMWLSIRWFDRSGRLLEKALHELFNPWRCGLEREWFVLPKDVEEWLWDGMDDSWYKVEKHLRVCHETVFSTITEILPLYYPADWLDDRINTFNALTTEDYEGNRRGERPSSHGPIGGGRGPDCDAARQVPADGRVVSPKFLSHHVHPGRTGGI